MRKLKLLCVVLLASSLTFSVVAQDKGNNRVGGIRLGYHGAGMFMESDMYPGSEGLGTFYAGLFRDNQIISLLHFGTGLEYFQNGIKFSGDNKRALYYLSIPLDLKLKLGPVFALTGLAPSFKVAERVVVDGNSSKPGSDDKSAWFDAPFFVGGGLKILFITIEVRYHWGLIDVYEGYNNRYLQIGAGLSF
jgi:hypothetical protein